MDSLDNFRTLGISDRVLAALEKKGFQEPSPIQKLAIPLLLSGEKDVIGQAQTGTGKTAAFGIPIIDTIKAGGKNPKALILSPTRELSIQIADELNSLQGESGLKIIPLYGGQFIGIQLKELDDGVDIAVGTPGRIMDLMERGKLSLDELQFAVLDEADEMLDMGFVDDIRSILEKTPAEKRMLLFSATMPDEILSIAEQFMRPGYEIARTQMQQLSPTELTDQYFYVCRREQKLEALSRIIDMEKDLYALIFCRTRTDADELAERLTGRGYKVEVLHGDIAQAQRLRVINGFKAKNFQLLIATDVAARGIDVSDLTHVINYSIPESTEAYVHRIGRTGRAGKRGIALSLVTPSEIRFMGRLQKILKCVITKKQLPTVEAVLEARKQALAEEICRMIEEKEHCDYLSFAEELLTLADHPAEIIGALLKMRFHKDLLPESYAEMTPPREEKTERDCRPQKTPKPRVRLSTGKAFGMSVPEILELVNEKTGVKGYQLGHIDCYDELTYITASEKIANLLVEKFKDTPLAGTLAEPGEGERPHRERIYDKPAEFRKRSRRESDREDRPRFRGKERFPRAGEKREDRPFRKKRFSRKRDQE